MTIAFVDLIAYKQFQNRNYDIVFLTGICFWVTCILAAHQLKLFTERLNREVILNTLILFFLINTVASLMNLFLIITETGSINPFLYQGMYQKYFIGTGDFIRGISFDTSNTNALLNAFGILFFLKNGKYLMSLVCMCILLLTGSNLTNILLLSSLIFIFIFYSGSEQKSVICICFLFFAVFISKISPQNQEYAIGIINKVFPKENKNGFAVNLAASLNLSTDDQKKKFAQRVIDSEYAVLEKKGLLGKIIDAGNGPKPSGLVPDINGPEYQSRNDSDLEQTRLINFAKVNRLDSIFSRVRDNWQKKSGKLVSIQQLAAYYRNQPGDILTGTGMGQFSSKLAFRATALDIAGGFPKKYGYVCDAFLKNHLAVFIYFFTKQKELHSITNTPDSVYNQLMGEYGLAGILAFLFFYLGYFLKSVSVSIAIPYIIILVGAFAFGYWFEQLSIVPFFELILFLNRKEL